MKKILLLFFIVSVTLACKKDDPKPADIIQPAVGVWHKIASEGIADGKTEWFLISQAPGTALHIRNDGNFTDEKGVGLCCPPNSLSIDGNLFQVTPANDIEPALCIGLCPPCETWNIETNGDEMTISGCNGLKSKYIKLE